MNPSEQKVVIESFIKRRELREKLDKMKEKFDRQKGAAEQIAELKWELNSVSSKWIAWRHRVNYITIHRLWRKWVNGEIEC